MDLDFAWAAVTQYNDITHGRCPEVSGTDGGTVILAIKNVLCQHRKLHG